MAQPLPTYQLVTDWSLAAAAAEVWEELTHPERWPHWWKGVKQVQLLTPGDAGGVGAYRRMTWRSALPYELTFNMRTTHIEPQRRIEAWMRTLAPWPSPCSPGTTG